MIIQDQGLQKMYADWEYDSDREEGDGRTYMGALGVTHKLIIGKRSLLNSSLAAIRKWNNMGYSKNGYRTTIASLSEY